MRFHSTRGVEGDPSAIDADSLPVLSGLGNDAAGVASAFDGFFVGLFVGLFVGDLAAGLGAGSGCGEDSESPQPRTPSTANDETKRTMEAPRCDMEFNLEGARGNDSISSSLFGSRSGLPEAAV